MRWTIKKKSAIQTNTYIKVANKSIEEIRKIQDPIKEHEEEEKIFEPLYKRFKEKIINSKKIYKYYLSWAKNSIEVRVSEKGFTYRINLSLWILPEKIECRVYVNGNIVYDSNELTIENVDNGVSKAISFIIKEDKKRLERYKEQLQKEQEQQSKSKTVYSVELFNNEGDTETSTDCNSYDEAIQAMEKYRNNKTQYVDSWGLSGKGRIIKFTEDENGNMSNEKVLKTFWL